MYFLLVFSFVHISVQLSLQTRGVLYVLWFIARPSLCCVVSTHSGRRQWITGVGGCAGELLGCQHHPFHSLPLDIYMCCPLYSVRGGIILYIRSLSSLYKSLSMIISLGSVPLHGITGPKHLIKCYKRFILPWGWLYQLTPHLQGAVMSFSSSSG